jgi:formamidopyrimidine-DNA glycosylase
MPSDKVGEHKLTGKLGISPLDKQFTPDYFKKMLKGKKSNIKSFLLDQKNIAGIGNVYIQDILFLAKLHPQRAISSLSDKEIEDLHKSMQTVLKESIKLGGLAYEKDFYGNKGKFGMDQFKVGYKEGKPCPVCGTTIQKIKTGSTSTFICPKDQPLGK